MTSCWNRAICDEGRILPAASDKGRTISDTDSKRSNLQDRLRVVRRRKWIFLQAVILVPAAAVAYSFHQQALYSASADVLINSQNAESKPLANEF